jgi:hypothetical protein
MQMEEENINVMKGLEDPDSKDFYSYLKEAQQTDLSDIERTGCISLGKDLKSNPVIMLIPVLGTNPAEKVEVSFRKMLLLFIRNANSIVNTNYSVVYAHTNVDIINQYPLIYKFYSVLPRAYKKNLQKMYVIHPNYGIKMFFEFARVFLSHKFYSKLVLLDSILDFQKLIPPTQMPMPLKFLRKEDEIRGLKFYERLAPLKYSFDATVGTTRLMYVCTTFLRARGGVETKGIFRLAADAGEVNLCKMRLQYANQIGYDSSDRVALTENQSAILIGDITSLARVRPMTLDRRVTTGLHVKAGGGGGAGGGGAGSGAGESSSSRSGGDASSSKKAAMAAGTGGNAVEFEELPEEVPTSVVVVDNLNTVAQLIKLSLSYLPEPLVTYNVYTEMIALTRKHEVQSPVFFCFFSPSFLSLFLSFACPCLSTSVLFSPFTLVVLSYVADWFFQRMGAQNSKQFIVVAL